MDYVPDTPRPFDIFTDTLIETPRCLRPPDTTVSFHMEILNGCAAYALAEVTQRSLPSSELMAL